MDLSSYLPWIIPVVLGLGFLYSLGRLAGEVALIRLGDRDPAASVWQVWKGWRRGWLAGWTSAVWRLALVNGVLFLISLPAAAASLACIVLAMGGAAGRELFSNQPVPVERMVAAVVVVTVLLTILSIPATALGVYTRLVQRAVALDGLGVRAALLRGVQIVRCCFRDVFTLWLVLTTFQLLYALVALPLVSFLAVTGMALAWIVGAGVYFVFQSLMEAQAAFVIAALLGGLVFGLVLYAPMSLVDGLAATYVSVSWTRAYRQMAAGLLGSGAGIRPGIIPNDD